MTTLKIGIGVPSATRGGWAPAFGVRYGLLMRHIGEARRQGGELEALPLCYSHGHICDARTRILAQAVTERCTHLLWLDDDMVFPHDVLARLLRHGKAVVGANYPTRNGEDIRPTAWGLDGKPVYTTDAKSGLEKVSHLGMGCVLMDCRVFEMIEAPFFEMPPQPPYFLSTMSEDVYFFAKVRDEAGVDVWCDHDVSKEIGHMGVRQMTHADVLLPETADA